MTISWPILGFRSVCQFVFSFFTFRVPQHAECLSAQHALLVANIAWASLVLQSYHLAAMCSHNFPPSAE